MSKLDLPHPRSVRSAYQLELEKATGVVERRGLVGKRLRAAHVLYCVEHMNRKEWEALSPEVRAWVKVSTKYLEEKQDPPPYPDHKDVKARIKQLQAKSGITRALNTYNNRKGASYRARELMLKHGLDVSMSDHMRLLKEDGFVLSEKSLSALRTHLRRTVLVLYDNDYLKKQPRKFLESFKEYFE